MYKYMYPILTNTVSFLFSSPEIWQILKYVCHFWKMWIYTRRYYNSFMIYEAFFYVKIMFQRWHILVAIFHIFIPATIIGKRFQGCKGLKFLMNSFKYKVIFSAGNNNCYLKKFLVIHFINIIQASLTMMKNISR